MLHNHYKVDFRFLVARARATLDTLNYVGDNGVPADKLNQYAGERISTWFEALRGNDELLELSCKLLSDDGELEKLYRDGVDSIYTTANDSTEFTMALLRMGALVRDDDFK